jgi:hypothetical protein
VFLTALSTPSDALVLPKANQQTRSEARAEERAIEESR